MYKNDLDTAYENGVKIACALGGVETAEIIRWAATNETLLSSEPLQTSLCKIAQAIYILSGQPNCDEIKFYEILEKRAGTLHHTNVAKFIQPVLETLAANQVWKDEVQQEKSAAKLLTTGALSSIGRVGGSLPATLQSLLLLSGLTGAGLGGLTWALNRDATQNSADVDSLNAQADHYKRLASDLNSRLKLKNQLGDNKKKKVLKDLAEEEVDYVV